LTSNFTKHFFHLLPQALFPGLRLPSSFNPVRPSLPARLARPHEVSPVDLIKTRLQQGDASLRTKSALPVLMRTNLTFLSVQSSRCHSLHHKVDRLFLRGTRSLARHIRIVNPVHSFSFHDWLIVVHVGSDDTGSQQRPRHRVVFYQLKSSPWRHGHFTYLHSGPKTRTRKTLLCPPHAYQFREPPGRRHHPRRRRLRIEPLLSAQGSV
jgi:hypothetical protein